MNILLVYATYSNSTYSASEIASAELQDGGHSVEIVLAREAKPEQLQAADLVIVASPSWDYFGDQGQPHEDFLIFNKTMANNTFPDKKFAVLGLGDSTYTYFCGAVGHLEATIQKLQGKLLVESLKIDQYYINEATATQQIKDWARNIASKLQIV